MKRRLDMRNVLSLTLRAGLLTACLISLIGGAYYLFVHGSEPRPDYVFRVPTGGASPSSLAGIWQGILHLKARALMQAGVCVLVFTPLLRVAVSLAGFVQKRDWLYTGITLVVLLIIFANLFNG